VLLTSLNLALYPNIKGINVNLFILAYFLLHFGIVRVNAVKPSGAGAGRVLPLTLEAGVGTGPTLSPRLKIKKQGYYLTLPNLMLGGLTMDWTSHARFNDQGEPEVSTALFKHLVNVTDPILRKWRERGLEPADRGWWSLARIIEFFRNSEHKKHEDSPTGDAKADADVRLKNAKAELAELDLAIRKGLYYPKEDVHTEWAARCAEVRASLLNLCRTIPIECAGRTAQEIEGVMTSYVEAILQEFQRGTPETPGSAESPME